MIFTASMIARVAIPASATGAIAFPFLITEVRMVVGIFSMFIFGFFLRFPAVKNLKKDVDLNYGTKEGVYSFFSESIVTISENLFSLLLPLLLM